MGNVFKTDRKTGLTATEIFEAAVAKKNRQKIALENAKYHSVLESEQVKSNDELAAMDAENLEKEKRQSALNDLKSSKSKAELNKSNAILENKLYSENKDDLFRSTLFEMAFNASWVDEDFKFQNIQEMYKIFEETLTTLEACGIKKLQESTFLESCRAVVEETCKKASVRLAKQAKDEGLTDIDFSLNEEEENDLDEKLSDLGKDQIEELVKNKVLTVIQDEKELSNKKKEEMEDINNRLKENDDDDDEDVDISEFENDDEDDEESEASKTLESLMLNKRLHELNDINNYTVFEALMVRNNRKLSNNIVTEGIDCSGEEKMNAVMIETITQYTILETLNVLKMYDFNGTSTKKLSKYIINTK